MYSFSVYSNTPDPSFFFYCDFSFLVCCHSFIPHCHGGQLSLARVIIVVNIDFAVISVFHFILISFVMIVVDFLVNFC